MYRKRNIKTPRRPIISTPARGVHYRRVNRVRALGLRLDTPYNYRRRPFRRQGPANSATRWTVNAGPFPSYTFKKLKYSQSVQLTTGAAGVIGTGQVFRLNSLFDPDFTGVGHQPYGYDQITPHYRRYQVFGCHILLKFTDPSADQLMVGAMIGQSGSTFVITGITPSDCRERSNCVTRSMNDSGSQIATISKYFSMAAIEGISKSVYTNSPHNYGAFVTGSPALSIFVRIGAGSDNAGAGDTVKCLCTLTYYAKFWELKQQASS